MFEPGEFSGRGHEGGSVACGGIDEVCVLVVEGEALEYGAEIGVWAGVDDAAALVEEGERLSLGGEGYG